MRLAERVQAREYATDEKPMQRSPYHHIIGSNHLFEDVDSCIYLDGINNNLYPNVMSQIVYDIFDIFDQKISQILVSSKSLPKSQIKGSKWLDFLLQTDNNTDFSDVKTIQFFPSKRKTIDETWRPQIYLSITFGYNVNSLFFSIRNCDNIENITKAFNRISRVVNFCSGYIYDFPTKFSSLAYYWGVVMEPAGRPLLRFGEREALRLEAWRDNVEIGILGREGRKFYSPCDGYVRDVYPTMILSKCHRHREIKGEPLIDFIAKSVPVSIEAVDDKVWLRVPREHLLSVQRSFDENQISLSGARISL